MGGGEEGEGIRVSGGSSGTDRTMGAWELEEGTEDQRELLSHSGMPFFFPIAPLSPRSDSARSPCFRHWSSLSSSDPSSTMAPASVEI